MSEHTNPLPGQVMLKNVEFDSGYDNLNDLDQTTDIDEANAITSRIAGDQRHKLIVDIDFPVQAIPSSTPGHFHLYIDKAIEQEELIAVVEAMADAGIVEPGYAGAVRDQKFTTVRLPWVKKEAEA